MQKITLTFIIYLIVSCKYLPESIGQSNEIIILTSPQDKMLIEPLLANVFSKIIHTPHDEQEYILNFQNSWEIERYEDYGNIIVASLKFPEDSTADILTHRILKKYNQDVQLFTLSDLYAKNQLLFIIHALDAVAFENILKNNREWILKEYNAHFEKRMTQELFKHGKNNELSDTIFNILGYTIDLQPDFQLIRSDPSHSFVWVGRGYPYRWITLHKSRKDNYMNIQSAWRQLVNDFASNIPEIEISKYYQKNEKVIYKENKIPVMRGIYEHSISESGGPFFVYIFETEQTNEVILISGFVNYPGHEKILLLKQLEIMAKTLHKGDPT